MSNPAFRLIGLDALRNDPRYASTIDGNAPDHNSDGQPDRHLTVVVLDTGVDTGHQLLSPNILAYVDFINGTPVITNRPPAFSSGNFTVPENTTGVGSVMATDEDAGTTLTFSIVGGADQNKFTIDSVTGALSFNIAPDFESPGDVGTDNVYDLRIQVSDGQNLVEQDITITVTDVDEVPANQAPTFTNSPSFTVAENRTTVGNVTASDPENNPLSFSITGGSDQAQFVINASTGSLSFVAPPDYETPRDVGRNNIYDLQVSVFDGQNTVNQNIAVTVTDVNDRTLLGGILSDNNDPDGHGTHVSGIIGATDPNIGVANNVDLIGLRVLGEGQDGSEVARALQWVLDHRAEYNIVAVNMSLGIRSAFYTRPPEGQDDPVYNSWGRLIQELEQAGVTVVSAAGNSYAQNHQNPSLRENVSIPAIASTAAVGAVWQDGTVSNARWSGSRDNTTGADRLVSFSQRLSTYPGMLFAPGAIIESTLPGNQIGGLAGTSMATPMVSGVVALMQDAALTFGDRLLTPNEIRRILLDTADRIVDGDDEDTNVTPTGSTYLRIDVYDAVQAVDRLFTSPPPPRDGTSQFFRFVFNSNQQTEDFYQGYGYAAANTYTLGQSITPTGSLGSYTITEVINDQSGTVGEVAVTDYYDGSTGFGYAIYVDASGSAGLGSESGFAYNSNLGGPDTSFSSSDTADLQELVVTYQLYYFTYNYNNDDPTTTNVVEGDFYQGYGYAPTGTYTVGQRINQSSPNETGNNGYYTIDSVSEGNYGLLDAVSVYSYYDGADGNGSDLGGAYGYASYVSGTGYGGLGTEEGYAYDYNYASADSYFSKHNEANLSDGVVVNPPVQLYYFTYTYGNGDSYQGWGYANANTYQSGQVIAATEVRSSNLNEVGLAGQYVIDSVWESYGLVDQVTINSYYDGADGNNTDPGGSYGSAYYVSGSGYGGLGSESGSAYDYNYQSTDTYFDNFYEANLITQQPGSQLYYFTYYYGNGDFYQGYGYAVAGTYTQDQRINQTSLNETGQTGYHIIDYVYDSADNYYSGYVYVNTYYDSADGNGNDSGGGYGYAYYVSGSG
ncbi:S8 family serine peptidase, partial [Cylindrospermopsis raciborskii]|uniref:S8 family serine peptidase n=1 Tax=Cylindrospermopsis raciborskii TaxID=77022 RepID=UPI001F10884D